jgi:hypothetical protein
MVGHGPSARRGGRADASGRGIRRGRVGRDVERPDSFGRPRLLGGTLEDNGCKAFLFFEFLARQGMQVLKILLPKSEEVSLRNEERACFCMHEEQYFDCIEEVKVEEQRRVETRRLSPGQVRSRCIMDQSEASKTT